MGFIGVWGLVGQGFQRDLERTPKLAEKLPLTKSAAYQEAALSLLKKRV
jgi:hypothetical protein